MLNNIHELATVFAIERSVSHDSAVADRISKRLYRYTPNGLGLIGIDAEGKRISEHGFAWGVAITGIVEGTDIEGVRRLMFPFTERNFWDEAQSLADELDNAKAEWDSQEN